MTGTESAQALVEQLKTEYTSKKELRQQLGEALNVLAERCSALDNQILQAEKSFVAENAESFEQYLNNLP